MKHSTQKKSGIALLLPVMFGFFVMGFVDVVGIATNYVKVDFKISETLSGLLPMMVFLWFGLFSIPTGLMMNRIGRKKTVLISMAITVIAMLVPLVSYNFTMCLVSFSLLGLGNTILQVSLNPLVTNIINKDKLASVLTFGQFIKAIASFLGPIIATFAAGYLGNWKIIFPIYAAITIISTIWLIMTPVSEEGNEQKNASFASSFGLLKDSYILVLFMGILMVVGADVGLNISIPKVLMERAGLTLQDAGLGTSLYFAARTIGTFIGALLLAKYAPPKLFIFSMIAAIIAYICMMTISVSSISIYITVFIVGFMLANIFSIIFSAALQHKPEKANEISALMVMGIAGGALFPFIMGVVTDNAGIVAGMGVILFCMVYLLFTSFFVTKRVV